MTARFFDGRLKINYLFIPVAVVMCLNSGITTAAAFFVAFCAHEMAHAAAARALNLKIESLELLPFGCAANIESFAAVPGGAQVIIAAAGPGINILLAAAVIAFSDNISLSAIGSGQVAGEIVLASKSQFASAFLNSNLMLAAINLLPALPLDGGRIMAAILGLCLPGLKAARLVSVFGIVCGTLVVGVGVYLACIGNLSPTAFFMGGFMVYGATLNLKNRVLAFMVQSTERKRRLELAPIKVQIIAAPESMPVYRVMAALDAKKYCIVNVVNEKNRIIRRLDEGELLEKAICGGADMKIGEL